MLWKHGIDDGSTGEIPHTGLGILARSIQEEGHEVFIADHHFNPDSRGTMELLERERPALLCVTLVSQEWHFQEVQDLLNIAHQKGIEIWVGGPHAHGYWDILEKDSRFSKIVVGEADGSFGKILNSRDRVIHLPPATVFQAPDFTLMLDHRKMITYPIYTSRGCTHCCSFCVGTRTHGSRWRARPLDEHFWTEIDRIEHHFPNVNKIAVIDDAFTGNLEHAKSFLQEYLRRAYPYQLTIFNVRADQMDLEFLQLVRRTGIESLCIGIESGDPEVFQLVKKGESLQTIRNAIDMMREVGITPWLNMVIGLPGDSPAHHERSLEWVLSIPQPRIVQWLHFAPYRYTWAYEYFVKQGAIQDGFIPGLQSGRYSELPESACFETKDFSLEQKMLAQLRSYLSTLCPLLILNEEKVKKICAEQHWETLFEHWKNNAPIQKFIEGTLPSKVKKGQLAELADTRGQSLRKMQ
jgi:radical SAM superfamily enzyme YgiQ (UPF0313 family)